MRQKRLFINASLALPVVKFVGKLLATRAEPAAGRGIRGTRNIALQDDPPPCALLPRIRQRNGRKQRLSVRMRGHAEYLIDVSDLDDLAEIHHRNAVGDMPHDRQIVSDEKIREPRSA